MNTIKPISLAIAALALTGCAATKQADERLAADGKISQTKFDGGNIKSSAAAVAKDDVNKMANFSKSNRNWVNPNPLARGEEQVVLPEVFSKRVSMTMPGRVNAVEVLSEMQRASGLKFNLAQDVYNTTQGQARLISAQGGSAPAASNAVPLLISDFVFSGTLKDSLDLLASKANVSWKWTGANIEIFRFETRTYNISALAGATNINSSVGISGSTAGQAAEGAAGGTAANSGTSSSGVARNAVLTTWDEVRSFLVAQLSSAGSLAVLESSGAVTVTDIPAVHARIDKTITNLNALMTKQVHLNVDIYSVKTNSNDNVGVDWNLVWSGSRNSLGFTSTAGGTARSSNGFSVGVLTGPFAGTNVVMSALSTVGNTSLVNQFSVTTLNGQPAPIASNRKFGYLSEVKVTSNDTSTTAELIPASIDSGLSMNLIPKIEPNGQVILEYILNLSDLIEFRSFSSSGSSIEIPTIDIKTVSNRAVLRSGQTLVLSGFKQKRANNDRSGVGSPNNLLLGGSRDAGVEDQYLVVTVTPYIAQTNSKK